MPDRSLLLQGGIVLTHDGNDHVTPTRTDILVENGEITRMEKDLEAPTGVEVINCENKIISPGFIDTHHHGWQTQLKGRHANEQLVDYMITGNAQSFQYSPEDVFYGQLAGMLESISAGTTTLVDHAHITGSPEHARSAIAATASSGIRSIYCYTPIMRVKQFSPLTYHPDLFADWVMPIFHELADHGPFGGGRVTLGFAFDFWFLPAPLVKSIFAQVKGKGVKTITCHGSRQLGGPKPLPQTIHELGLLDESIIISHGGKVEREDAELILSKGARVSSTPSTELQMAMGRPYAFDAAFIDGGVGGKSIGLQSNASFGADCHSCTGSSIISEAKLGLQSARNLFNEHYLKQGFTPRRLPDSLSVEAAFNLATVKGAEAVRMADSIGRISVGYKADLVIFDTLSPSMIGAAQHDPVAAVILHSSPADIETVIVDGTVRKRGGKLMDVAVDDGARHVVEQEKLGWQEIAGKVVGSRERMQVEMSKIDIKENLAQLMELFHADEGTFVDV